MWSFRTLVPICSIMIALMTWANRIGKLPVAQPSAAPLCIGWPLRSATRGLALVRCKEGWKIEGCLTMPTSESSKTKRMQANRSKGHGRTTVLQQFKLLPRSHASMVLGKCVCVCMCMSTQTRRKKWEDLSTHMITLSALDMQAGICGGKFS